MPLDSGTRLGHYEIKSPPGAGGMGEVYLALDTKLDRKVALKIPPSEFAEDKDRMSRFVRAVLIALTGSRLSFYSPPKLSRFAVGSFVNPICRGMFA